MSKYEIPKNFPKCKTKDLSFCEECLQDEDCSDECNCRCQDYTPYSDQEEEWKKWYKDTVKMTKDNKLITKDYDLFSKVEINAYWILITFWDAQEIRRY